MHCRRARPRLGSRFFLKLYFYTKYLRICNRRRACPRLGGHQARRDEGQLHHQHRQLQHGRHHRRDAREDEEQVPLQPGVQLREGMFIYILSFILGNLENIY